MTDDNFLRKKWIKAEEERMELEKIVSKQTKRILDLEAESEDYLHYIAEHIKPYTPRPARVCQHCGREISPFKRNKVTKFCSQGCRKLSAYYRLKSADAQPERK